MPREIPHRTQVTNARKERLLELVRQGQQIRDALKDPAIGVSVSAYDKWRRTDRQFAGRVDALRAQASAMRAAEWDGGHAMFAQLYFGMTYAGFHLEILNEIEHMIPGDILLVLMPPEHGKTTMFENYASEKLGTNPDHRFTIASENITISKRIVGRIKNRMEPDGPFPAYVKDFGPFKAPDDLKNTSQVWSSLTANVYKKRLSDERDYSLMAIGRGASIVSTRTDHLHVDDIQSLKTAGQTTDIMEWFRQDALSRPGERGITTVMGTRVRWDDFYRELLDDDELRTLMRVVRFPALRYNALTKQTETLWPERYTEANYNRMRIKAGPEGWARNYMQEDGDNRAEMPYKVEVVDSCKNSDYTLGAEPTQGSTVYVSVDPALGSFNVVMASEVTGDGKLIIRELREDTGFVRNEQIMEAVNVVVAAMNKTGHVTDVIWEAMNFQAGLARDERLVDMAAYHGFTNREHLTGHNKYDPDVGVNSMVESFRRGDIILPWAPDDRTRAVIGELRRQLCAWRPGMRGTKLRQDMVMALWFQWIFWQQRRKRPEKSQSEHTGWKRQASPWRRSRTGLLVPT